MWMIPFVEGNNHFIYINFTEDKVITGIKFWNYNKNKNDIFRGV
jgi:hypothetical protein